MTLLKHELRQGFKTTAIWTAAIAGFVAVCVFMYPEMNFTCAEFTHKAFIPQYEEKHDLLKGMKHLRNSDAHYLENMVEASCEIDIPECTARAVVDYILNK